MPSLKGDEEVKEKKWLKHFSSKQTGHETSNIVSTTKESRKQFIETKKMKSDKWYIFCIRTIKSTKKIYNELIKSL